MWRLSKPLLARRAVVSRRVLAFTASRFSTVAGAASASPAASALSNAAKGDAKPMPKLPMLTIADVLSQKEAALAHRGEGAATFDDWESIPGSQTIEQAVNRMVEHNIGALIVTEEKQGVVGIVTERDVLKKVSPRSIASELLRPVNEIMSKQIVCTPPTVNVLDALATMSKENIRHLAVVKGEMTNEMKKGVVPEQAMRSVLSMRTILKAYADFLDEQNDDELLEENENPAPSETSKPEAVTKEPTTEKAASAEGKADAKDAPKADKEAEAEAADEDVTAHQLLKERSNKVKLILNTRPEDNISVADAVEAMARHDFGSVVIVDQDLSLLGVFTERDYMTRVLFAKHDPMQIKVADVSSRNLVCLHPEDTLDECLEFAAERRCRHYPVVAPPRNDKDNELVGILSIKNLAHEISKNQTTHSGFHLMEYLKKKKAAPAAPASSTTPAKKEAEGKAQASSTPTASAGKQETPAMTGAATTTPKGPVSACPVKPKTESKTAV